MEGVKKTDISRWKIAMKIKKKKSEDKKRDLEGIEQPSDVSVDHILN